MKQIQPIFIEDQFANKKLNGDIILEFQDSIEQGNGGY
jgi:hypothetical protein